MIESIAVVGMILGLMKSQQQPPQPQYYYHPQYQQQYYYPQQQQYYYVPNQPQQVWQYQHQPPAPVASPNGTQGGPQGYYYGQPPQATTYQTGY